MSLLRLRPHPRNRVMLRPGSAPVQLSLGLESRELSGLTPQQRGNVLTQLASLLIQAANLRAQGVHDDEL